jgi:hypothetical protein
VCCISLKSNTQKKILKKVKGGMKKKSKQKKKIENHLTDEKNVNNLKKYIKFFLVEQMASPTYNLGRHLDSIQQIYILTYINE